MPTGSTINRDPIYQWVLERIAEDGHYPTNLEIAERFGCSTISASVFVGEGMASGVIPRRPGKGRQDFPETKQQILDYLSAYFAEHQWMPSQREIADHLGITGNKVNRMLGLLRAQGLIQTGPDPRQIRIIGTNMKAPDQ